MKRNILSALILTFATSLLLAGEEAWMTDHARALEKAKSEKKIILMDFTGSDWCGWCIKLDKEVFGQKEFQDYAEKNLVLLKLDFPRKKDLPADEKKQNDQLASQYKVSGFPTLVALDSEGAKIWEKVGYLKGGPSALIAELEKLKK